MHDLLAFVLAALALTGSPGPATLALAATGAAFGAARAAPFLAGLMAGIVAVMAIAASGVSGLILALPGAAEAVAAAAAAYILYLAWRIANAPPLDEDDGTARPPTLGGGAVLQMLNPKAYAAMAALFSGYVIQSAQPLLDALAKMTVLFTLVLAVNLAWLFAGAGLTRVLRRPAASRALNIAFAVLLVTSVALTLVL